MTFQRNKGTTTKFTPKAKQCYFSQTDKYHDKKEKSLFNSDQLGFCWGVFDDLVGNPTIDKK